VKIEARSVYRPAQPTNHLTLSLPLLPLLCFLAKAEEETMMRAKAGDESRKRSSGGGDGGAGAGGDDGRAAGMVLKSGGRWRARAVRESPPLDRSPL
jgi:hypothetical protein